MIQEWALRPFFCFWAVCGCESMHKAPPHLTELVRGAVETLGYEMLGVEYLSRPKSGHLLRIYIDGAQGIGLADCEKVSHQVSGVLEVEEPIRGEYSLEVSSPGFDRPLFELAHFERFVGQVARVKLNAALNGRSNYKGTILEVDGDDVVLQVDGERVQLPFAQVSSARLVPEF
jgi:ribosome maturation factor RimP